MELLVIENVGSVLHEDDDILVIDKPAGISTHAPSPLAPDGMYEWLRRRFPRWHDLAIVHRLDKETSGVMVFSKTTRSSRSLTRQFEGGKVRKTYYLETDRPITGKEHKVETALVRSGERYVARPPHAGADLAVTRFQLERKTERGTFLWKAQPLTGRTHQIRVHAAELRMPILGDELYGGTPAARMHLHAAELRFDSVDGLLEIFRSTADFPADSRQTLRTALIDLKSTDSFRLLHGAGDGWDGWYVDKVGDTLLSQGEAAPGPREEEWLRAAAERFGVVGVYHKTLARKLAGRAGDDASPRLLWGVPRDGEFRIRENGVNYLASYAEGYSCGLFFDQRENRRRLLGEYIEPGEPIIRDHSGPAPEALNLFAYTCGFSVCAAMAGFRVTSVDLSRKYLEWGKRNFTANKLDPSAHDFIYGDVFDWMRRLEKKSRRYHLVILDPPTFSRSKESGVFQAEKDYPKLVRHALGLLAPRGLILASSNAAGWKNEDFVEMLQRTVSEAGRSIGDLRFAAQPLDFPVNKLEPAYLKTAWVRLD